MSVIAAIIAGSVIGGLGLALGGAQIGLSVEQQKKNEAMALEQKNQVRSQGQGQNVAKKSLNPVRYF